MVNTVLIHRDETKTSSKNINIRFINNTNLSDYLIFCIHDLEV